MAPAGRRFPPSLLFGIALLLMGAAILLMPGPLW